MERITNLRKAIELIDDLVSKGYKYRSSRTDENLIDDVKKDITRALNAGDDMFTLGGTKYIHQYFINVYENEKEFQFSSKVVNI
jgi:hypothetical protein